MSAIKASLIADRARAEKRAVASAIRGPRVRKLGIAKQSLGIAHKPAENTSADEINKSTTQPVLHPAPLNCKGKQKSPDTEESSGSLNKRQKSSTPYQEDIAKSCRAESKLRRNSQASRSSEKNNQEDHRQTKPLSHLRKGKYRCVAHAKSLRLRELCEKGELK